MSILRTSILLVSLVGACSKIDDKPRPVGEDLGRRLTDAECESAVDHAIRLLDAEPSAAGFAAQMKEDRAARVAECVARARLRDHRCLMAARTFHELGLCPMPGGGDR